MTLTLLAAYALGCAYVYIEPSLPSAEGMRGVELQVPLRVYTRSGQLIAQIGEQRRNPVTYEEIPKVVRQAFLAAEDDRFFRHTGVDFIGVLRAVLVNLVSGDRTQGASTITMQAARNMFLSQDKTWRRKLQETFLTYRMEREFGKEQILGLYLNVIFFGQRAYGVAAASETFFGKPLADVTVAEAATLAGIPKAPSRYNPIVNPKLAQVRRGYVLRRMRELGYIDAAAEAAARAEEVQARTHAPLFDVEAPYVAEMARLEIRNRFGPAAESAGYKVFTTVDSRLQSAANRALRIGLVEYDRRHGWRGAAGKVEPEDVTTPEQLEAALIEYPGIGFLLPAVVVSLDEKSARVYAKGTGFAQIDWDGLSWASKAGRGDMLGPEPARASQIFTPGDVVHVVTDGNGKAQLAQVPEAQAALVALNPTDGAVAALVGGFDYFTNKYNRVTQARRQPGSAFKPFLYSAALEHGFTPASVIPDAPVVLEETGAETTWRPENSGGQFHGPTRLREALVRSRNLVSIRLLRELGTPYSIDYVTRFGFAKNTLPRNLTLALGTLQTTPLELAAGFATFANGGHRVAPYFIDRIEDAAGNVVWSAEPRLACEQCDLPPQRLAPRVISPQNAWLITDMMADVITRGTGRRALALGRNDLAGKTGTTNDAKDAWFNGFNRALVATVWVGLDQERSLGEGEEGARTAVPIWVHFMREALRGVPPQPRPMPDGLVRLRISPETGLLASAENP
ncbi:MAG TPA: penicillin-binding protein 1A, partial [Steroidobacteraceae bacterium]|nr:penicillin-binding protein 1A [Steroidobacteraceae bacterium]